MTGVFDSDYAKVYDLLYQDKDYAGEASYIAGLVRKHASEAISVLDLGSGTGKHADLLARDGFEVHGVELSEDMLAMARGLNREGLSFSQGDIRSARVDKKFDAVLSLFHVISYLPQNEDIMQAFETARHHLESGGLFIFDVWYGPAVLTDRPVVRVKRLESESAELTRIAEPTMHAEKNLVQVDYTLFLKEKASEAIRQFKESHLMRYMFTPEMRALLETSGFELIHTEEWMSGRALDYDTWGACFVARAL
jgi:SAM-dependent methyltransferase